MLVKFRSAATESITMFGDHATQLLKHMGATGKVPGAFNAEDVHGALQRLESAMEEVKAATHETAAPPADNEDTAAAKDKDDDDKPRSVSLATRAVPLLSLLKRAAAADVAVMWEAA